MDLVVQLQLQFFPSDKSIFSGISQALYHRCLEHLNLTKVCTVRDEVKLV